MRAFLEEASEIVIVEWVGKVSNDTNEVDVVEVVAFAAMLALISSHFYLKTNLLEIKALGGKHVIMNFPSLFDLCSSVAA